MSANWLVWSCLRKFTEVILGLSLKISSNVQNNYPAFVWCLVTFRGYWSLDYMLEKFLSVNAAFHLGCCWMPAFEGNIVYNHECLLMKYIRYFIQIHIKICVIYVWLINVFKVLLEVHGLSDMLCVSVQFLKPLMVTIWISLLVSGKQQYSVLSSCTCAS